MPGTAKDLISEYWKVCEEGDFNKLMVFFADDAVLLDPIYGTFNGHAEIAEFMAKITDEMKNANTTFVVDEVAGDESTAWARWKTITADDERIGGSIFTVQDGLITFEQDYTS